MIAAISKLLTVAAQAWHPDVFSWWCIICLCCSSTLNCILMANNSTCSSILTICLRLASVYFNSLTAKVHVLFLVVFISYPPGHVPWACIDESATELFLSLQHEHGTDCQQSSKLQWSTNIFSSPTANIFVPVCLWTPGNRLII